jgi:hypothetical protein
LKVAIDMDGCVARVSGSTRGGIKQEQTQGAAMFTEVLG